MKILITGITGFIGTNLYEYLINKNEYEIYALVRSNENIKHLEKNSIKCFNYKENDLELLFKENNFDGVIHLASKFIVNHQSEDIEAIIESNILFPTKILEMSCKYNLKWFINTGTFWQHFDNQEYMPVNLYASTKQSFEDIAKFYTSSYDINFVTLKLNDTYGIGDTRPKVFNLWLKIAKSQESLDMSAGEQLIDIVYIDDVISGYDQLINLLIENKIPKNSSYCISSGNPIKLKDMSKIFEKVSKKKLNINWGAKSYRPKEVMIPWNNGILIPQWSSKVSLEEGIKKFVDSLNTEL